MDRILLSATLLVAIWLSLLLPAGIVASSGNDRVEQKGVAMFELRSLPIAGAHQIDGLKLVDASGVPKLLYSTQSSAERGGQYEMVISAVSVGDAGSPSEVATLRRLLPVPPLWDARLDEKGNYDFVLESAGGAINSILFTDGRGQSYPLGPTQSFESFTRPHFVRGDPGTVVPDIGATADERKVVVFPQFDGNREGPHVALADGEDGIVIGSIDRMVVAKSPVSGPAAYDVPPGQLSLIRLDAVEGTANGPQGAASKPFPDRVVYEFDAASGRGEVFVFATAKPSVLLLGSRPARAIQLAASDRRWLNALSLPTISVSETHVHIAAVANRGAKNAVVLYGALAIDSVLAP